MGENVLSSSVVSMIAEANQTLTQSFQRLSSSLHLTPSLNDVGSMSICEHIRASLAEIRQGVRNIDDGVSMAQTAEGAASQIGNNLVRMKALATQASSGTLSEDQKSIIQTEFNQLAAENVRIADTTEYNGIKLFTDGQSIPVTFGTGNTVNINTQAIAQVTADLADGTLSASETVDAAINQLTAMRGGLGSVMAQLESASQVTRIEAENMLAAQSRISDVDVAQEIVNMAAAEVQAKAAIAVASQANVTSQTALSLIE